jgi:phosphomannomutase
MESKKRVIALFDVDATLTPARKPIEQPMLDTLDACMKKGISLGIVSGSDLVKVRE